jgi:beta-glucosidase
MAADLFDLDNQPGLTLSRYQTHDLSQPAEATANHLTGSYMPIETRCEAVKIEGYYKPSIDGSHYLSFSALGPSKLFINDDVVFDITKNSDDPMGFLLGGVAEEKKQFDFVKGKEYRIRIESLAPSGNGGGGLSLLDGLLGVHTGFMLQQTYEEDLLTIAVESAKSAEVAIVFVGHTTAWETEGAFPFLILIILADCISLS